MSQQINLFNPIFLKQKKIFTTLPMLQALGVLLAGALALGFYGKHSLAALQKEAATSAARLSQKQARQAAVNAEYAPRQKDPALAEQIEAAQAELQSLRKVSTVLKSGEFGNTFGYSPYFKALARQRIGGLWLTGVSISGAGSEIAVQGRALQPSLVPDYIGRLTREAVMRGKTFAALSINALERPAKSRAEPAKDGAEPAQRAAEGPAVLEFNLQSTAQADRAPEAGK